MTNRNAIITLKRFKSKTELSDNVSKAIDIAINELEKKLNKKPIHVWVNMTARFSCPECGCAVFEYTHICECGQILDWSDWK